MLYRLTNEPEPNNSFNPTARQHGFHRCLLRFAWMLHEGGGLNSSVRRFFERPNGNVKNNRMYFAPREKYIRLLAVRPIATKDRIYGNNRSGSLRLEQGRLSDLDV